MRTDILKQRILPLQTGSKAGESVLYIMSRDQRVQDNHALLCAQKHALAKSLPLAVVFCLYPASRYRSKEQYVFMLKGLREVEAELAELDIPFIMVIGKPLEKLGAVLMHYNPDAVYFDFNPLRGPRKLQQELADRYSDTAMYIVDTHNIVPAWVASPKREVGAYTMRPKLHKLLETFLVEPEEITKHPVKWKGAVKPLEELSRHIDEVLHGLKVSAVKHSFMSGSKSGINHLEHFITTKLPTYAVDRNDPSAGSQSDLSPYLHFGQVSSLRVALRLREVAFKNDNDLHFLSSPKMPKPEEAQNTLQHGIDSLIEEMVVRKELADNYCYYCEDYDNIGAAPAWARASLDAHRDDPREHLYTYEELVAAKTHDEAWNASQIQLTTTGKMHGYMRMYWAKKVLEWTESPEQAIEYLIRMNDFYSLDGGDPNGYTGILWSVAGVHDRPWFERPIFGVIRYMNYEGLKRKFDIDSYKTSFL